jgi:hypothetical protein
VSRRAIGPKLRVQRTRDWEKTSAARSTTTRGIADPRRLGLEFLPGADWDGWRMGLPPTGFTAPQPLDDSSRACSTLPRVAYGLPTGVATLTRCIEHAHREIGPMGFPMGRVLSLTVHEPRSIFAC